MLSVANSCHYNENFKNWQTSFTDKCPPLGSCPNKSPPLRAKAWMQKPQGGANVWCKSPGVRARGGGGWLWMKLIPALAIVEAIASLRSIILRRIYILTSSVLLFPMTPHEKNTRVMLSPSQRSYDCFLSVEASLLVHAEKCGRGKTFGMPSNRIDTDNLTFCEYNNLCGGEGGWWDNFHMKHLMI